MCDPSPKTILAYAVILLGATTCHVLANHTLGDAPRSEEHQKSKADHTRKTPGKHLIGRDRAQLFEEVDKNHDGLLTFLEFSGIKRLARLDEAKRRRIFDMLDRNKDGNLQLCELQCREPGWLRGLRRSFDRLDINRDGTLDFKEFTKLSSLEKKDEHVRKRMFAKLDRNQNGTIERSELRWRGRRPHHPRFDFSKYDKDNSNGLSYEEYSKIPWINKVPETRRKKLFQRIDVDKNGEISPDEVRNARPGRRHRCHDEDRPVERKHHRDKPLPHQGGKNVNPRSKNV